MELQNSGEVAVRQYKGIQDCLSRISFEQGILSLWRGNGAGVIRCFPNHALNFAIRDFYRNALLKNVDRTRDFTRFVIVLSLGTTACGGLGGATTLLILYPFDFARTRLAVDAKKDGSKQYSGMIDCLRKIKVREGCVGWYRSDGLRGFYRGALTNSLRSTSGALIITFYYEFAKYL
uniref:ADP/ATP translocase n=1 Tax=Heterorhabditis bacteriophora TaxID=37862 RepID=A0A1I7XBZ6_HETBA